MRDKDSFLLARLDLFQAPNGMFFARWWICRQSARRASLTNSSDNIVVFFSSLPVGFGQPFEINMSVYAPPRATVSCN